MKYNTKIKIIFGTLMIVSTIIGIIGLIYTVQMKQFITFENMNPMILGFLAVPLIKFVGLQFLK